MPQLPYMQRPVLKGNDAGVYEVPFRDVPVAVAYRRVGPAVDGDGEEDHVRLAVLVRDAILEGLHEDVLYRLADSALVYGQAHVYGLGRPEGVLFAVQGVKLADEFHYAPGYLRVGRAQLHPIEPYQVVVLLYVLARLPEGHYPAVVEVSLVARILVVVLRARRLQAPARDGHGRVVCRLAE